MPSQDRQPVHLTLRRTGDVITADLAETGVLIPRSETHVDDAFLDELVAEMGGVARIAAQRGEGATGGGERGLARVGGLIFSHLLTEPARRCLTETPSTDLYLRLDERLVHVPWELCHDGRDFLITKFRVGRQVITAQPIPEPQRATSRKGLRVLLVADPTETLPHAVAEAERLCSLLDDVPGIEVTLLAGKSVRRVTLLAALQEHDVVHFAGHSHYDPAVPSRSGWRLAEGVLTAAELAKLRPPPFLVFSNSCEAATSASWGPRAGYEPQAFGIGSAFLLAGVPNYVGTFWVLHDAESLDFATACHRALVSGASLGESLDEARRAVIAAHGRDGLTWASYSLYGDPAFRPLDTGAAPAPEPNALRSAPAREPYRFEVSLASNRERRPQAVRVAEGPRIVGRDADLARLETALRAASRGERQVCFVSGPPGMGKTALVETLTARVRSDGGAWIAHGQAIEQYGSGEAYLPLLEALGRLGRETEGSAVVPLLRRHAPTWLAQLPGLVAPAEHETLLRWAQASTRERMLRELAELFEAIAREHPIVLLLEDLHWSDHSTLESIAYLAQRREPARLLVIGTYRPAEVSTGDHPLRAITQELRARRQSEEIRLEPLDETGITAYLRARLGPSPVDPVVPGLIFERTEGHPLFFVAMVDYALREGLLAEERGRWTLPKGGEALASRIPDGLRPMIERQVETLGAEEQSLLEAAGVVGAEFSIAEVAAALEADPEEIDDRCEALAWRGQLLRSVGIDEWPDGTVGGRYRFTHALYQNVLYDRVAPARRVRLHRRIGERKEAAFGIRSAEIAGELASHFEAARDTRRAVDYRIRAGEVAVRRYADREAIDHFRRALALLPRLGEAPERLGLELSILVKLATPLMSTEGYAASDVGAVFERAHALSRQVAPGPHLAPLLRGLVSFYQVRARLTAASEVGEELLALCERGDADAEARVQAHYGHGVTLYDNGRLEPARVHLERALELYDVERHPKHVEIYGGYDPGAGSLAWLGWIHWLRGSPDRAMESTRRACELADKLDHRFSTTFTCLAIAIVHLYRGEVEQALPHILRGREIAREDGFAYQGAVLSGTYGWASLVQGRTEEALPILEESLRAQKATGAEAALPAYLRLLAYAKLRLGDAESGLAYVREGLEIAERNQDMLFLGPMYRAHGELLLACGDQTTFDTAEAAHRSDLRIARELDVPIFELEAVAGLARFLLYRGRRDDARELLAPVCDRLGGSVDESVLRDVRQLLAAC